MIFECQIASPAFLIRKKILGANHGGAGLSPPTPPPAVTPKIFTLCTSKGGGKSESRPGRHKPTLRHCSVQVPSPAIVRDSFFSRNSSRKN